MRVLSVTWFLATIALSGCGQGGLGEEGPSSAAESESGLKGGHGPGSSVATLTVSPNPVPNGTTSVVVTGAGFEPGQQVWTGFVGLITHMVAADAGGAFSYVESHRFVAYDRLEVNAYTERGGNTGRVGLKHWVLTASTTLTVLP